MNDAMLQLQRLISLGDQVEEDLKKSTELLEDLSADLKAHNKRMWRKLDEIAGDTSTVK